MIYCGDALTVLRTLDSESVDCIVTSPPYFGLRDYGVSGQIGLESSLPEYLAKMVEVFEECRRVLKKSGTCWVNMGDSYASGWPCPRRSELGLGPIDKSKRLPRGCGRFGGGNAGSPGLKEKDLMGVPWRLAFALQDAGWYLRQDIIWSKPNPMPESVRDRCTKSHEYVFMLTRSARYWYDADAIREPHSQITLDRWGDGGEDTSNTKYQKTKPDTSVGNLRNGSNPLHPSGANKRSVWSVATKGYAGAHFATYPPELIKPMILAGCPEGGICLDPFLGSGTTIAVALELGRQGWGIELNPEYVKLAEARIADITPSLWA